MSELILFVIVAVAIWFFTPIGPAIKAYFKSATTDAKPASVKEAPVAVKPAPVSAKKSVEVKASPKLAIPEDSVLKRHFLAQLQSEIEATLFPRPTEATLQRHYDTLVAAEVENRLYGR